MKKVSIVMPTYNGARYLNQSIDSCLCQTYPEIELIVVVDGSTDETPSILSSYTDPRMQVVYHEKNCSLPVSLNTGFANTKGEYLTWTSDDNWYAPNAIEEMVSYLEHHPEVGLVYTNYWLVSNTGECVGEVTGRQPESILDDDCVGACFLYRRNVYETTGDYNYEARPAEDYEYWLRVSQKFKLSLLDQYMYYYRKHESSLTGRFGWFRAARAGELAKYRLSMIDSAQYQKKLAFIDICEAFERYNNKEYSVARRCVLNGFKKDFSYTRNRGVWSILLKSLFK